MYKMPNTNDLKAHRIDLVILKDYITVKKFNELFDKIGDLVEEYVNKDFYSLWGAYDDESTENDLKTE
jgi:hypothetical protein